jgi:hypothetical protein
MLFGQKPHSTGEWPFATIECGYRPMHAPEIRCNYAGPPTGNLFARNLQLGGKIDTTADRNSNCPLFAGKTETRGSIGKAPDHKSHISDGCVFTGNVSCGDIAVSATDLTAPAIYLQESQKPVPRLRGANSSLKFARVGRSDWGRDAYIFKVASQLAGTHGVHDHRVPTGRLGVKWI